MSTLPEGTTVGQYRIIRKIGEGGMGEVFEAVHQTLGRRSAIKVLHAEHTRDPDVIRRFFNEARAVNLIDHPGLVQIYDFGQMSDGTAYIVMEYLKGESLAGRSKRMGGVLAVPEVVRLGYLVADGLAAAHAQDIVHRDLKPDNVMIITDPNVAGGERTKLLDFGIAKLGESSGVEKTRTTAVMGTPHFMSPEQCRGAGGVDDKTDVYALGVMLYLLLAGRMPFDGEGVGEIMGKHMYEQHPPLGTVAPYVPTELAALVDGLLVKDKQERPAMWQVAASLAQMQHGSAGVAAAGAGPTMALPQDRSLPSGLGGSQRIAQQGPRRAGIALLVAAVLLVGGFAGVRLFRAPKRQGAATTTAPRRVSWQLDSEPAGAEVVRISDGEVLGHTPWRRQQAAAAGVLRVRLRLFGHAEREVSLMKDADATHMETLLPLAVAAPPAPAAPPTVSKDEKGGRPHGRRHESPTPPKKEIRSGHPQIED